VAPGRDERRAGRRVLRGASPQARGADPLRLHGRTAGDHPLLKYDGTPERFQAAVATHAPDTQVKVLAPGEPLALE
jgi:hypothetical protein